MSNILIYLVIPSFFLSALGALLVARFGERMGLTDSPNDRSSHTRLTPRGGGVGIFAVFVLIAFFVEIPIGFLLAGVGISSLSLVDDRVELSSKLRLVLQFILAGIALWAILPISWNMFLLAPVYLIFIVGTANFYNFMDGINGIAGITGVVAFGFVALFGDMLGADQRFILFSLCISVACLGFLPFNTPHARVFMGDVGSILLGFLFSASVILLARNMLEFICYISFLFPFYADELTTIFARFKNGENLLKPHRRHLYQILANQAGIPHWQVATGYGITQLLIASVILLVMPNGYFPVITLLIAFFLVFTLIRYHVQIKFENLDHLKS